VIAVSPRSYLEPAQWYAGLPTAYVSAGVLITDSAERVLIVKPNYRPYWALPGGMAEENEPPHECAARECAEEIGLRLPLGALLVIDWAPPRGDRPRPLINFLFDGGRLADPARIRLQEDELDDFALLPADEAADRLPETTAPWIGAGMRARKAGRTIYLPTDYLPADEPGAVDFG
jgi:8-oxo-dGTP pyrophosphatase MutT (NUDIX family)